MSAELEAQIDQWRRYVRRQRAITAPDADEMEDHLREQVRDLRTGGLDDDEAFLVAVKRMGNLDAVSREFAREHSDRLWKQLVLVAEPGEGPSGTHSRRELAVVLALAIGAGVSVKLGLSLLAGPAVLERDIPLLIFPFLAGYFAWKRHVTWHVAALVTVPFAALAVVLNVYPFDANGSTATLAAIHSLVVLWLLLGVAYIAGRWRSDADRMDFVRFTGEFAIYLTLIALGGAVLIGLTAGVFNLVGIEIDMAIQDWILPFAVPGAIVVAAWLVEAKQSVVENIAPVLTRVFTPLTIVMLLVMFVVLITAGDFSAVDRDLLILMDAVLVLVLCLLLYSISARDSSAQPGLFDWLTLVLLVAAVAVDAVALAAMATRVAEFGFSPNKVAAMGLNVLLLIHLVWSAVLTGGFVRGHRPFGVLARWQTRFLPVYGAWAAFVVVAFPPIFGFA